MSDGALDVVVGPMANWVFGQGYLYLANKTDRRAYALAGFGNTTDGNPAKLASLGFRFEMERPPPPLADLGDAGQPLAVDARLAIASPPQRFDAAGGLAHFPTVYVANPGGSANAKSPIKADMQLRYNHPLPQAQVTRRFTIKKPKQRAKKARRTGVSEPLVVVGVIDDGLPFAHGHLRDSAGRSRVDYHWLQAANGSDDVSDLAFGRELTGNDIDALIVRHDGDEDAIYADPAACIIHNTQEPDGNLFRRFTHGAHVLESAAGFGSRDLGFEVRDRCRIVGVQLPRLSLRDTSGFAKETYVLSAVHYVLDRAERIAAAAGQTDITVLINVSLGTSGGPKNGQALIEKALDEVVNVYSQTPALDGEQRIGNAKIVFAAGNSFESRMNCLRPLMDEGADDTVFWRVQPNDRTASLLEIWLDDVTGVSVEEVATEFGFAVAPPGGDFVDLTDEGGLDTAHVKELHFRGNEIGQMSLDLYGGSARFMVIIAPTEHEASYAQPPAPTAPAGLWRVRLTRHKVRHPKLGEASLRYSVHRDEDPANTGVGGRQSYFDRSNDEASVTGFGSINGWATRQTGVASDAGQRIVVAGFTAKRELGADGPELKVLEPATYSAAGFEARGENPMVDASTMSNRSTLLPGIRGAGTRTGATTVLVGTSSTAPTYVRTRVLELFGYPDAGREDADLDEIQAVRLGSARTFER